MSKTPYFLRNENGTFTFLGYFITKADAVQSDPRTGYIEVVDASFLYRTIEAAKEALNTAPLRDDLVK